MLCDCTFDAGKGKLCLAYFFLCYMYRYVELCVAKQLTPQTLDLEVQGSSLARHVV